MVKVLLIGATGNAGSRIQTELLNRGHEVTAITRDPSKIAPADNLTVFKVNVVTDDLWKFIAGHHVVVNAFAPPMNDLGDLVRVYLKLVNALKGTPIRLLNVGGAGGLQVPDGSLVINQPWFPKDWVGIAQAHIDALEICRASDINWTTLTPPGMFAPGERTGKFRLGTENFIMNEAGESKVSMEDYAIALVDEIENPQNLNQRFSIGY